MIIPLKNTCYVLVQRFFPGGFNHRGPVSNRKYELNM